MRKILVAVILLLGVALVLFSFSELENIVETLQRSDWRFLIAAIVFEILWMYNMAITMRLLYRLVGLEEESRHLFLVVAAANFVNVVAPSAGIGGMAVFLDAARQRNHSAGKVTVVSALFVLMDYLAFLCVLALGLAVLVRRNNLTLGEITASLIMLAIASVLAFLFYLGYRSAARLGRALAWLGRLVNNLLRPFLQREYLKVERAYSFAAEMTDGYAALRGKRWGFVMPFLFALNNKAILICVLAMTFLAFGTPFTTGTLVGGFSIGYLFVIVSPTPSGIGFVEGALPVALKSLRVQWEAATLITLVYRGITFWFPLGVGAAAFRILQGRGEKKPPIEA